MIVRNITIWDTLAELVYRNVPKLHPKLDIKETFASKLIRAKVKRFTAFRCSPTIQKPPTS